jgi:fatty acid desaturase
MSGELVGDRGSSGRPLEPEPSAPAARAPSPSRGALRARTVVYFLGLAIILAALAWAALLLGVPESWIGVGLLLGLGIILIKGTRFTPHPPC